MHSLGLSRRHLCHPRPSSQSEAPTPVDVLLAQTDSAELEASTTLTPTKGCVPNHRQQTIAHERRRHTYIHMALARVYTPTTPPGHNQTSPLSIPSFGLRKGRTVQLFCLVPFFPFRNSKATSTAIRLRLAQGSTACRHDPMPLMDV